MFEANRCVCRNPESLGDGNTALVKLRTNRPKVWFEGTVPGLALPDLKALFFDWANRWSRVCNVEATEAPSRSDAHWLVVPARIDGRNGVLADMMLPGPSQQVMRLDVSDTASPRQLGQTIMHEVGHGYGLMHLESTPPPDVMEPVLNPNLDEPQATESKLMASMYGPPKVAPAPPVPPTSNGLTCTVRLTEDGKTIACEIGASKPGFSATLKGSKAWEPVAAVVRPVEQVETWDDDDTEILGSE